MDDNDDIIFKKISELLNEPDTEHLIQKSVPKNNIELREESLTAKSMTSKIITNDDIDITSKLNKSNITSNITGKELAKYIMSKYLSNNQSYFLNTDDIKEIENNILIISHDNKSDCIKANFIKNKYLTNINYVKKITNELYKELLKNMNNTNNKNKHLLENKKAELALCHIIMSMSKILSNSQKNNNEIIVFVEQIQYLFDIIITNMRQTIDLIKINHL